MKLVDSFDKVFKNIDRVMVVMAHPDDCEIICGGTIARLIDAGKQVRLIVATNGGKGMQDRTDVTEKQFAKIRIAMQQRAGIKLGILENQNFNLNVADGEMENSLTNIEKVAWHIRDFKPELIITHNPEEVINHFDEETSWANHRDHRMIALTTVDAAYPYSRDRGFFPHHFKEGLVPHTVEYLMFSDSYTHPKRVAFQVDKFVEKKAAALAEHGELLTEEERDGFIEELKHGKHFFEILRLVKI